MTRWERWAFNTLHGVVAVTGLVYFYMKYLLPADDPFAVINHPWQPSMLAVHVVAAPVFILVFGMVLRSHVLKKLLSNGPSARWSGWFSLVSFAAMALSGYLLQIAADPFMLRSMLVAHVGTSLVFVAGYTAHLILGLGLAKTAPAADTVPEPAIPRAARLFL